MSVLLCMTEARFWSYAFKQWTLPEGFASFLAAKVTDPGTSPVTDPGTSVSPDPVEQAHTFWQDFFEAGWKVEAQADSDPDRRAASTLLQDIFWWSWPIVQWIGRLLAHCGFMLVTDSGTNTNKNDAFAKLLLAWLMDFFWRLGDTKCIEETHKLGREIEQRSQQADL